MEAHQVELQQPLVNQNGTQDQDRCPSCGAKLKRPDREGEVHLDDGKEENPSRVLVRITSYRVRLIDKSNLFPKYFVDALRYAGFLRDDGPKQIEEEIAQVKVDTRDEERTEIDLIYPDDDCLKHHNPKPLF